MLAVTQVVACKDKMARYEYKVKCFLWNEERGINKLADEGWELVCSYCLGFYLIFRREKR